MADHLNWHVKRLPGCEHDAALSEAISTQTRTGAAEWGGACNRDGAQTIRRGITVGSPGREPFPDINLFKRSPSLQTLQAGAGMAE